MPQRAQHAPGRARAKRVPAIRLGDVLDARRHGKPAGPVWRFALPVPPKPIAERGGRAAGWHGAPPHPEREQEPERG